MTMLEGYAIPLDQAALKTFLESIAVHYQCIALHILGPSPESSVPGQEYPCHLCNEHYTTVPDAGADASPNMFRMACQQCINHSVTRTPLKAFLPIVVRNIWEQYELQLQQLINSGLRCKELE